MKNLKKGLWLMAGGLSLALGVIGIVLPILPTTPFVLLAAFCFARNSERLHGWLITHRLFGPGIQSWNKHGAISKSAKTGAIFSMMAILVLSLVLGVKMLIILIQAVIMLGVATFILTRPSPPT